MRFNKSRDDVKPGSGGVENKRKQIQKFGNFNARTTVLKMKLPMMKTTLRAYIVMSCVKHQMKNEVP